MKRNEAKQILLWQYTHSILIHAAYCIMKYEGNDG